jgi:hypothetical protein
LDAGPIEEQTFKQDFEYALDWWVGTFLTDLEQSRHPEAALLVSLSGSMADVARRLRVKGVEYFTWLMRSPPSPGYEPFLLRRGENPLLARMKAYITVAEGKKISDEMRRYRGVAEAIRSLAMPNCSREEIARNIRHLLFAAAQTWVIRRVFLDAELDDSIFIYRLSGALQGNEEAIQYVMAIATQAAPKIRIPRGQKVTAASAAHEMFLEKNGIRRASAYTYSPQDDDFVDEATLATRLEFPGQYFDPRSASRRLHARRHLAGFPVPRRNAKVA